MLIDGFEAGIRTTGPSGRNLREYGTYDKQRGPQATREQVCWIEAESGATFEIYWRKRRTARKADTAGEIWVDGRDLLYGEHAITAKSDKTVVVKGTPASKDLVLEFVFKDLDIHEEDDQHKFKAVDVTGLGEITLMIQRGSYTHNPRALDQPTPSPFSKPFYGPDLVRPMCGDRSQYVGYGSSRRVPGAGAAKEFIKAPNSDGGYDQVFRWLYRSRKVLQKMRYIPPDPAPPSPFGGSLSPPPSLPVTPDLDVQPLPLDPPPRPIKPEPRQLPIPPLSEPFSPLSHPAGPSYNRPRPRTSDEINLLSPPPAHKRVKIEHPPPHVTGPEGKDTASAIEVADDSDDEFAVRGVKGEELGDEVRFVSKKQRRTETEAEKIRAALREKADVEKAKAEERSDEEIAQRERERVATAIRVMQQAKAEQDGKMESKWAQLF